MNGLNVSYGNINEKNKIYYIIKTWFLKKMGYLRDKQEEAANEAPKEKDK